MLRHFCSRYSKHLCRGQSRYDVDADWAAYWRNLANTIESSVYGGDVALYQIRPTFTSCWKFEHSRLSWYWKWIKRDRPTCAAIWDICSVVDRDMQTSFWRNVCVRNHKFPLYCNIVNGLSLELKKLQTSKLQQWNFPCIVTYNAERQNRPT